MKQQPPNKQLRLMLTNLYQTYNLSIQTLHTAILILMNPNLPENANQDPDICIAALHLSQKLHESIQVSVSQLCYCAGLKQRIVLDMQKVILESVGFKIAQSLLIDECFEVTNNWDEFICNISCIDVRFFKHNRQQKRQTVQNNPLNFNQEQEELDKKMNKIGKQNKKVTIFAYKSLIQICQKLAYNPKTKKWNKKKLSLAIVALIIKQSQRYQDKTLRQNRNHQHFMSNQDHSGRGLMRNLTTLQHKSTDYIIADFMNEVYGINYQKQLIQEIKFIKSNNFGLKDLTTHFKNVKNITERSPFSCNSISKRSNQSFRVNSSFTTNINSKINTNRRKNKKCL